ncbi:MAG: hypothetical protein HC875_00750 [Anaerolineales bacterium]|nr:hypothetical protein [Anaerolineales bacterium]
MKLNYLELTTTKIPKYLVILSLLILLFVVVGIQIVLANQTPKRCDEPERKYGCFLVEYTASGNGWEVQNRKWQGAIDGGAKRWQAYWTKDWEYVNNSWVFREKFGPSSWRTNISMSGLFQWSNDNRIRIRNTLIWHKFRYEECAPDCYFWCSRIHEHHLWDNTSLVLNQPANCGQ